MMIALLTWADYCSAFAVVKQYQSASIAKNSPRQTNYVKRQMAIDILETTTCSSLQPHMNSIQIAQASSYDEILACGVLFITMIGCTVLLVRWIQESFSTVSVTRKPKSRSNIDELDTTQLFMDWLTSTSTQHSSHNSNSDNHDDSTTGTSYSSGSYSSHYSGTTDYGSHGSYSSGSYSSHHSGTTDYGSHGSYSSGSYSSHDSGTSHDYDSFSD
jgi:hypothetical protein